MLKTVSFFLKYF